MKLLLDTHAFIWWDSEPSKLSAAALAALQDPANEILLSAASTWEMVIKAELGKLVLRVALDEIVRQQRESNGVQLLPVTMEHTLAVRGLPPAHKDPFDRILIAQAGVEGATLVSADSAFDRYPVTVVW